MTDTKNSVPVELFVRFLMMLVLAVVWAALPFVPIVRGAIAVKRWSERHEILWMDLKWIMFVASTVAFLGYVG